MSFAVNLPHLLLLQNIELMLLTLIISSLVKDFSLQKMWSLLIVTLIIKLLMAMISLFLSLKLSVPKKLMALRKLLLGEVEYTGQTIKNRLFYFQAIFAYLQIVM